MDLKIIIFILGKLSLACAMALVVPLGIALIGSEASLVSFVTAIIVCVGVGAGFIRYGHSPKDVLTDREGIAITALTWIMITFLGMIPYAAGGYLSVLDSVLECISGLSGTGATVINDIEVLPQSILLWRSMTHWFGGLGIIVIFIALFPQIGRGSVHMFNAESTGPTDDRTLPRVKEMAKALFTVYVTFTTVAAVVYMLCGMTPIIAVDHAMSTIATGGFSPYNDSVAHFDSPVIEGWIIFFMVISSANFGMYVAAWRKGWKIIFRDMEFRTYIGIVVVATMAMALNLICQQGWNGTEALRQALFQAVSLSSSTGFVSSDFDQWPAFSKSIILMLMFIGGCAGSTAGGFKVTRIILIVKTIKAIIYAKLHPRMVLHVHSNGDEFSEDVLYGVARFFFVYAMLDVLWATLLVFDGVSVFDAISVSISTMGSCGPAFGQFGATCTYASLPVMSKVVVCVSMLMGRLESFTVLALFMPSFWRRGNW